MITTLIAIALQYGGFPGSAPTQPQPMPQQPQPQQPQQPMPPQPMPPMAQPTPPRAASAGKPARCTLRNGEANWAGRCRVAIARGGTFTIRAADGEQLPGGLAAIRVVVVAPGQAEIGAVATDGRTGRWGPATRSASDPACWGGSNYMVCAY